MNKNTRVISSSRRTDIPAFYMDDFMCSIVNGKIKYTNSFTKKNLSIETEGSSIVFWTKNFKPACHFLKELDMRHKFYIHYTITGLGSSYIEPNVPDMDISIDTVKYLSNKGYFVIWRYDPIILDSLTMSSNWHVEMFNYLSFKLKGYTSRCHISFINLYEKVVKRFNERGYEIIDPPLDKKLKLVKRMKKIAKENGITLYSCCNDYLVNKDIIKAKCIDDEILNIINSRFDRYTFRPSRDQCGCVSSVDVGDYKTCKHGCLYCYAN
jgi:DNA repair photolyase